MRSMRMAVVAAAAFCLGSGARVISAPPSLRMADTTLLPCAINTSHVRQHGASHMLCQHHGKRCGRRCPRQQPAEDDTDAWHCRTATHTAWHDGTAGSPSQTVCYPPTALTEPRVWHIAYDYVAPPPPQYALSKTGTHPVTIHLAAGSYTPGAPSERFSCITPSRCGCQHA